MIGRPAIAVLGCGAWGRNLVRNFHALGALGAVVDVEPRARAAAHHTAPLIAAGASLDEVMRGRRITGVAIATPAETHVALCHEAMDHGLDVFCEKPLALAYADGERVAVRAEVSQRVLMVGHILEYHPGIRALRGLVETGTLGELRHIHASRLHPGGTQRESSLLWGLGPHDVAIILRLAGELPSSVSAQASTIVSGVHGVAHVDLRFPSGLTAHVHLSVIHRFKEQRIVVVGSKRTAVFDDVRDRLTLHQDGCCATRVVDFSPDEPLRLECEAFIEAMATRQPPETDARSALGVLQVIEQAEASLVESEDRAVSVNAS